MNRPSGRMSYALGSLINLLPVTLAGEVTGAPNVSPLWVVTLTVANLPEADDGTYINSFPSEDQTGWKSICILGAW